MMTEAEKINAYLGGRPHAQDSEQTRSAVNAEQLLWWQAAHPIFQIRRQIVAQTEKQMLA